jgi:diguanylate cyclase (GGDEF)-like protein
MTRAYHPGPPDAAVRRERAESHRGVTQIMNISPGTLLVIVMATTTASLLIVVGSAAWSRTNRARRMATVESLLASSYVDAMRGDDWSGRPPTASADSTHQQTFDLAEPVDTDPVADEPEATADEGAGAEEAAAPLAPIDPASARGRDALTGLLDAVAFEDVMAHEDARESRYRRPATVVILELDGLERLVERLGPAAGNRVEPALADTISRLARRADYVARLAPGQFAVLMPETDEIAAINYIERIRRACELWLESGAIAMRLAIGWAGTSGDASLPAVMRTATDRMHVELRRNARLAADAAAGVDPLPS